MKEGHWPSHMCTYTCVHAHMPKKSVVQRTSGCTYGDALPVGLTYRSVLSMSIRDSTVKL